jgi:hypothetical protein
LVLYGKIGHLYQKGLIIKSLKSILALIMIVVGMIAFFLYTPSGKAKISSMLSKELSRELGFSVDIRVKEIALSLSNIMIKADINRALEIEVLGRYTPWNHEMDLAYHLFGERVVFKDISFEDHVDLHGDIKGDPLHLHVDAQGKALNAEITLACIYTPKTIKDLSLKLDKISSQKVMLLAGEEPLLAGTFSLDAQIAHLSDFQKRGVVKVLLHRSGVYLQTIKTNYDLQLPDDLMLSANLEIELEDAEHHFKGKVDSTLGEIHFINGRYIEASRELNTEYLLSIDELSKVQFITKKKFIGPFKASGEIAYHDGVRFDGLSHSLDGEINYYYEKEDLEASFKDVSLWKLFKTMHYPPIMIGDISGKVEYDLKEDIALLNLRSHQLRFRDSAMTRKIFATSGVNFADELFTHAIFTSSIEDGIVSYDFRAENRASYLSLNDAKMDATENTISANFSLKMQGEELSGNIYGSLKSPKVDVDIGKYVEFKATKEIDAFFGKGTTKKAKKSLKELDVEDVKGFIKGFF